MKDYPSYKSYGRIYQDQGLRTQLGIVGSFTCVTDSFSFDYILGIILRTTLCPSTDLSFQQLQLGF